MHPGSRRGHVASVSPLVVVGWGPRCLEAPLTYRWPTAGFHNCQKAPRIQLPFGDGDVPPPLEDSLSTRAAEMGDLTHPQRSTVATLPFAFVDVLTFRNKPPPQKSSTSLPFGCLLGSVPTCLLVPTTREDASAHCRSVITARLPSGQNRARLFSPDALNIVADASLRNVTIPYCVPPLQSPVSLDKTTFRAAPNPFRHKCCFTVAAVQLVGTLAIHTCVRPMAKLRLSISDVKLIR